MLNKVSIKVMIAVIGLLLVVFLFAFEPLTRNYVAVDDLCSYCHIDREYRAEVRLPYSKAHPLLVEEKENEEQVPAQATCAECHLPNGFIYTIYAYAHFASFTDLFGHFRYRNEERAGAWIAPRQAAAFRVRDRLFEYDSPTCRNCHVEEEIELKRERGKNAHKKAVDEKMTCIECHYNEKHRSVDLRKNVFADAG